MIRSTYRFSANWKVWLFVLLLLPVLLRLGFWQLSRADEKRALLEQFEQQREAPPVAADVLRNTPAADIAFRRVALRGQFLADYSFLLDNQILDGRVGYHLLQPFADASGDTFLVNRGWLAGHADRSLPALPEHLQSRRPVQVIASVYVPAGEPVVLGEQEWSARWPLRVQSVDVKRIAAHLQLDLYPYVLRIEAAQPGALQANWPAVNTQPEKHTGYAVQWFAMSLALLLCGLFASLQKKVNPELTINE